MLFCNCFPYIDHVNITIRPSAKVFVLILRSLLRPERSLNSCGWYPSMISTHQWAKQCQKEMRNKNDWRINLAFLKECKRVRDIDADSESHAIKQGNGRKKIWTVGIIIGFAFSLKDFSFPSVERLRCFHLNDHDDSFSLFHLWCVFLIGNLLICFDAETGRKKIKTWWKKIL